MTTFTAHGKQLLRNGVGIAACATDDVARALAVVCMEHQWGEATDDELEFANKVLFS